MFSELPKKNFPFETKSSRHLSGLSDNKIVREPSTITTTRDLV